MSGVIAVLVVVGVLAAMLGDRLGHRLGKKRVSLFTLRPRHSGLLATCVAGGFIALVLSPLALWSAGLFAPTPDPLIVRVPVRVAARTSSPGPFSMHGEGGQTAGRSGSAPVAMTRKTPAIAVTPVASPTPDPRLPQLQHQLASAQAEILSLKEAAKRPPAMVAAAPREAALVARRGELLCAAKVPGNLSPAQAQAVLRDLLSAVETTARRRGAASGLTVPGRQLAEAGNRLQGVGAYALRLHAGRTSRSGEPLAVQLAVQPLPPGSLAELQEQDRLERAGTTAAQGLEQALAQVPGSDGVTALPETAYVPWRTALKPADGSLHLSWHNEPLAGGPLWLRLSVSPDRP